MGWGKGAYETSLTFGPGHGIIFRTIIFSASDFVIPASFYKNSFFFFFFNLFSPPIYLRQGNTLECFLEREMLLAENESRSPWIVAPVFSLDVSFFFQLKMKNSFFTVSKYNSVLTRGCCTHIRFCASRIFPQNEAHRYYRLSDSYSFRPDSTIPSYFTRVEKTKSFTTYPYRFVMVP